MKTLVIVAHPNIKTSVINKRWIEELRQYPDKYTIHELYNVYPDGHIDVQQEQQLIEAHDHLVLQFPIYWFSSPPLLKQWLDEVFTYGWAYGSKGDKLQQRKAALAVSVGIKEEDYHEDGAYRYTLGQLLSPFETTFLYCNADYRSFFAFYGAEHEPAESELIKSTQGYLNFIDNL
ncbi:NAD(P)H-dependent oxidoreductase [Paenibacillus pabuli]|uniref:NAD(P)H-dependent oxidoreductase n=1 Tax=Paenibacillus pabuli TaxID=1472 RepID=UPI000A813FD1|nr:NAD(P)H-dependent oxidoreductase [Paenibacillus pabuli]MEC0123653.1 NAD(P)H-dependent oxidoreductase [Paenibacillus pabuli]